MKFIRIIGWEIRIFTHKYGGRIYDHRVEYGNSPKRDLRSRNEFLADLRTAGTDYEIKPIYSSCAA